jgi:hypothetical protein
LTSWFRRRGTRADEAGEPPAARDSSDDVRFFFYFEDEDAARQAGSRLEDKGYAAKVTPPDAQIAQWSVIASGVPDTLDVATADDLFAPWAAALGGEYDGHEIAVG